MVRTVPHDFIGPLRPGTIRLPPPKRFLGPVRRGIDVEIFRRTGRSVPSRGRRTSTSAANRKAAARRVAREKAAREKAAREKAAREKAQREFIERAKLSRLQRERLDALAKLTKTRGAERQRLLLKKQQIERDIVTVSKKKFEEDKERKRIADIPFIRRDLPKPDKPRGVTQQTIQGIKEDIKAGKFSKKLKDLVDILIGGGITERDIGNDQVKLNERVIKFNDKFSGRELNETEFSNAEAQQKFIDKEQKILDNRTDKLVASKRNKFRDLRGKIGIGDKIRLTVAEQSAARKAQDEDVKRQAKIKANQPQIKKLETKVSSFTSEIKKLQIKKKKNLLDEIKLIRLKNKKSTVQNKIARLGSGAPPKILAGTFPIIPAANIPASITSIKFLGETSRSTKTGKVIVDISFKTSRGTVGFARGVPAGIDKQGKIITITAGRAGKIAVKFPSGKSKFIKIKSFIGLEKATTKSKVIKQIFDLEKAGKITGTRLKSLKKFTTNIFKEGKINKISLKNIQKTLAKLRRKKLKPLDLKKNLARLRRKALKSRKFGKATRGRKRLRRLRVRVLRPPKKIPSLVRKVEKKFREGETLSKDLFIKKIRALKRNGLISTRKQNSLIRRARKLARKGGGRIARSEFDKIVRKFRKPKVIRIGKPPRDVGGLIGRRPIKIPKRIDLRKNIARLKKGGIITGDKAKQLTKIIKTKRPRRLLDLRKNLRRLRRIGKKKEFTFPRETARDPGFGKIIKRLRVKALQAEKSGRVQKIRDNLRILQQRAEGQIVTIKGKKFFKPTIKFPTGKLGKKIVKGISKEDFASVSSILTKDQLSFIIGKSITRAKAKSEFVGVIRGLQSSSGFVASSPREAQQFQTALNKVISTVASAVSKAEKTKTLTKVARISTAGAILSTSVKVGRVTARVVTKPKTITQLARQRVVTKQKQKLVTRFNKIEQKNKQITKQLTSLNQRARQLSKTKSKQKQITKQKATQRIRQKVIQKTTQLQRLRFRLRQQQKQIARQIQKAPTIIPPPFVTKFIIPPILKKKKRRKIIIKKKKGKNSFDVFARPLKKKGVKKKPKLIKVNKRPLSQTDAKNLRNFILDTSLARTGRIQKRKGNPKKPKLKVPNQFARRTTRKFRRFRIVRGRRIPLRRGKVIERRRHLLDTKQERRKITLRRRIAQLSKPKKKPINGRRKIIRRKTPTPRKRNQQAINQQRLRNLMKARVAKARIARSRRGRQSSARTKLRRKISII